MNRERVTRGYFSFIPKWRTSVPEPFNWTLVKIMDVVPLALSFILVNTSFFPILFGIAAVWYCGRFWRRLHVRERDCELRGYHEPWHASPGVWRCFHCNTLLEQDERGVEYRPRGRGQARWSNRR